MGFLQDAKGNDSSTRLLGAIIIIYALLLATAIIILGAVSGVSILLTATAAGTTFTTIAGPAMLFLFHNKKEELSKAPM